MVDDHKVESLEIEQVQVPHKGSWTEGSCCCNCANLVVLRKHPWNVSEFAKGSVQEKMGYACIYGNEERIATFMDSMHGMCEGHYSTPERMKFLKIKRSGEKLGV